MSNEHYQTNPKESPTAQALILGEINALVSFWPEIRKDDSIGPEVAFDLLATWAHLRRFDPASLDGALVALLNALVINDLAAIGEQALKFPFPSHWSETSNRLDEAWDHVGDDEDSDELEHSISEHFELLDRGSLVVYAINRLLPAVSKHENTQLFNQFLIQAEEFLADNADIFLPAAVYASAMLDSYRIDLDDFDEPLWETTLKHRQLQELIDEQENPDVSLHLSRDVIGELIRSAGIEGRLAKFQTGHQAGAFPEQVREMSPVAPTTYFSLAAGGDDSADTRIAKLSVTSCASSTTEVYRIAWAHFLAATYRGTGFSEEWLHRFIELAKKAESLDVGWHDRLESAEQLLTDRRWQSEYEGERVFRLEPTPLENEASFSRFLNTLVDNAK